MSYVELYNDEILDAVSIGKTEKEFNELNGDYIKVEILPENIDTVINTFYSNRLLLKYTNTDNYYFGDYHYHPENPEMGFCVDKEHTDGEVTNLQPIVIGNGGNEPLNSDTKYQKHFDIFKDNDGEIYIKPNELIKLAKLKKAKYKIRIYFLRNIKATLGKFLNMNKNNLIENGNFFAGLEATQTGDLDRSTGRNNFIMRQNPGYGKFVLEQDGVGANIYDMRITGITPNTHYIFSCWVVWDDNYHNIGDIVTFDTGAHDPGQIGHTGSDVGYFSRKNIGGMGWRRMFIKVRTHTSATLGSIRIYLGNSSIHGSTDPRGRIYFTDLRFEEVENFDNAAIEYIIKLKMESN